MKTILQWAVLAALVFSIPVVCLAEEGPGIEERLKDLEETVKNQNETINETIKVQEARIEDLEGQLAGASIKLDRVARQLQETKATAVGQTETEKIVEDALAKKKSASIGEAGWKKGFVIKSPDDKFQLKIGGRFQTRYTGFELDSKKDRSYLEMERIILAFSGYAFDPKLKYLVKVNADTDTGYDGRLNILELRYDWQDWLRFRTGDCRPPYGRQENTSCSKQMFAERSLANEFFNVDMSPLVGLDGLLLDHAVEYSVAVFSGFNSKLAAPEQFDTHPAYAGRLVWNVFGDVGTDESDLAFSEQPGLALGASYAYADNDGDTKPCLFVPATYKKISQVGFDIHRAAADAVFKWQGLSLGGEWFMQTVRPDDPNLIDTYYLIEDPMDTAFDHGFWAQCGYFVIPKKLELISRVSAVLPEEGPDSWEYGGGLNYYFHGHNSKVTVDVLRVENCAVNSSAANYKLGDDGTIVRVQYQLDF